MSSSESGDVTGLLKAWGSGDRAAVDRLTPRVYDKLRRMSRKYMRNERAGHTLQATALVNYVYLRLVDASSVHFFAVCSQMMRRILVDSARARGSRKRGGGVVKVDVEGARIGAPERDALNALADFDPRKAQVIELRYFGGLSVEETAEVLKISPRSVMRDWKLAKAWLMREMTGASAKH
jgi:RNA polymerase sigma factor (TIGR02999 family)